MGKRQLPTTSHAAYKQAKEGLIDNHKEKIKQALGEVGIGNYELIASKAKMDRIACMRRLSELERELVIYKPGTTSLTKSGRKAMNYCLTEAHTLKVEHPATQLINKVKEAKDFLNNTQSALF